MIRHVPFPSINQFRSIVHNVVSRAQWVGKDADGNSIYDTSITPPKLKFRGAVKLHGTNAAVATDANGEVWCQSRTGIITPAADNAGFAMFVHANMNSITELLAQAEQVKKPTGNQALVIFGEWCGGNIQSGVALTQLPKMFVIFAIALADPEGSRVWFADDEVQAVVEKAAAAQAGAFSRNIYYSVEFPTWTVEIDFAHPEDVQQHLSDLTIAVEEECPVAKRLGATAEKGPMIGEGIVWTCVTPGYESSGYWFKVKGEKHAPKTRMNKFKPVDADRVKAIQEVAEMVTPEWRLHQMLQETFNTLNGGLLDIKRMGDYIKAVITDVVKEDLDIIADAGFTMKDVNSSISKIARDFMLKRMEWRKCD